MSTDPRDEPLPSPLNVAAKLDAMAYNYRGGHAWDALDSLACANGAAGLRNLVKCKAEIARLTSSLAERENTVDRLETEVARLTAELNSWKDDTMIRAANITRRDDSPPHLD
jgi:uncharacterized coiled-coil protein SlyX